MTNAYIDAIKVRRTQYSLGKDLPLPQAEVTALIQEAVRLSPSAFNSQSSRVVVLYEAQNAKFWDFVKDALRKIVPTEHFGPTENKINGFAAGAGTVLFYEDKDVIAKLQNQFATYAENFPVWSEHSTGIAQFSVWSALANAGVGASLQHYNPLPDAAVASEWNIPSSWYLRAQMPFGSNQAPFGDKTFIDDSERFRIFG